MITFTVGLGVGIFVMRFRNGVASWWTKTAKKIETKFEKF